MPANPNPIFTLTPENARVRLTTANTTRDLSSTTNAALLLTAAANGTRIDTIEFNHVAATQTQASIAAVGRIWICDSAIGGNPRLKREIALTAVTPSATAIGATFLMTFSPPLVLNTGEFLWAGISATQTSGAYDVIVSGGDF
jgi:hypothetical protein